MNTEAIWTFITTQGIDFLFKLLDLPAERRLGDVQPCGRAGEILLTREGHEIAQLLQFHVHTQKVLIPPRRYWESPLAAR